MSILSKLAPKIAAGMPGLIKNVNTAMTQNAPAKPVTMGPIGTQAMANKVSSAIKANRPFKKGGSVSNASKRADGCCIKGKTRGKII